MDRFEKTFVSGWVIILVVILAWVVLLGWGFVELVQWVTSK